jgi:hypothetical protein
VHGLVGGGGWHRLRKASSAVRRILVLVVTLVGASAFAPARAHASPAPPASMARARDDAQTAYLRVRLRTLLGCFALAGASGRAKGNLSVEVQPVGEVSDVVLEGPLPASVVACVAGRVRGWRFPPFDGQARRLRYSLVFVGTER